MCAQLHLVFYFFALDTFCMIGGPRSVFCSLFYFYRLLSGKSSRMKRQKYEKKNYLSSWGEGGGRLFDEFVAAQNVLELVLVYCDCLLFRVSHGDVLGVVQALELRKTVERSRSEANAQKVLIIVTPPCVYW